MDAEAARAHYHRWLPGLWNADPDDMARIAEQLFTPEASSHWGNGSDPVGPHAIAEQIRQAFTMFKDVSVSLLNGPFVDGDWITARWAFAGAYVGGIPGVKAPVGRQVRYTGMDLFRLEGDRFAEYWPYGNNLGLMQQLDALG
jgi:predicted ester cyclase